MLLVQTHFDGIANASSGWRTFKALHNLNQPHNMSIEFAKLLSRYPILLMNPRPNSLHWETREIIAFNRKAKHVANSTIARVPVPRNMHRVLLIQDGIEDRLFRQTRRKLFPPAISYKREFVLSCRPKKDHCIHVCKSPKLKRREYELIAPAHTMHFSAVDSIQQSPTQQAQVSSAIHQAFTRR